MLLEQLETLKRSGEAEMEAQKKKINDGYEQTFEEYKEKANRDAEKNISEIERNIQAQNQRLEDETFLQEQELEYLQKITQEYQEGAGEMDSALEAKVRSNKQIAEKQYRQNKKIKELKTKIDLLESSLDQIVRDFEKERELIKFQNEQIIKE